MPIVETKSKLWQPTKEARVMDESIIILYYDRMPMMIK